MNINCLGFLNKNPADRLGCNRESGFVEIMTHAFFKVRNRKKTIIV